MPSIIQLRRDTAANWTSADPTLALGEMGYETDTDKLKIGDGSTAWTSLGYFEPTAAAAPFAISDATDTTITTPQAADILSYDAINGWYNTTIAGAGIATSTQGSLADSAVQPGDNVSDLNNDAGYISGYTETDPIFAASAAAAITSTNITNWNTAYGWGDHSAAGYITGYTETDPIFSASPSSGITTNLINEWSTAYGWGDHSAAGYLNNVVEDLTPQLGGTLDANGQNIDMGVNLITDPKVGQWDTAYTWGDHSTAGYLTSYTETDPVFVAHVAYNISAADVSEWATAYGWGDHAAAGYVVTDSAASVASLEFTGGLGTMSWNVDEETVDIDQGGAVLQLGQEVQVHARNDTASTIPNGTVVMATGTLGASGRVTVAPMVHDEAYTKFIIGVATEDIAAGADGKVTTFGKVRGLDTSGFTEGAVLYASDVTPGALTETAPTVHPVLPIAFVINQHAVNGTIMVRITPIDELKVEHGDTAYEWGDHSLAGYLTSFTETDPVFTASAAAGIAAGDITSWDAKLDDAPSDGTQYVRQDASWAAISVANALNDLTDVNTPAPNDTEAMVYDAGAGEWVSGPYAGPLDLTNMSLINAPTSDPGIPGRMWVTVDGTVRVSVAIIGGDSTTTVFANTLDAGDSTSVHTATIDGGTSV